MGAHQGSRLEMGEEPSILSKRDGLFFLESGSAPRVSTVFKGLGLHSAYNTRKGVAGGVARRWAGRRGRATPTLSLLVQECLGPRVAAS